MACFLSGSSKPKITWDTTAQLQVRSWGTGANTDENTYITVDLTKDGIIISTDTNAVVKHIYYLHEAGLAQVYGDSPAFGYYFLIGSALWYHWGPSTWQHTTTFLQFENK